MTSAANSMAQTEKPHDEILQDIADDLLGTCKSVEQALEQHELDWNPEETALELLSLNVEQCPVCGWWVESWELVDDNGNLMACESCRR